MDRLTDDNDVNEMVHRYAVMVEATLDLVREDGHLPPLSEGVVLTTMSASKMMQALFPSDGRSGRCAGSRIDVAAITSSGPSDEYEEVP